MNFIENLHANTIALIVAIVAAIVTITLYLIKRYDTKKTLRQERISDFKAEFTEEIRLLQTGFHKDKAKNIINSAAIKHQNAMIRFRYYVSGDNLTSFDAAWAEYKNHTYNSRHSNKDVDIEDEKAQKELAIKNIEDLLKSAN